MTSNRREIDQGCDVAPITNWAGSWVGIDFDTHAVHLVKLEESGAATYTRCELIGLDAFERTRHVRPAMPGASYWDDVVAVAIEQPMGPNKNRLGPVQGAILACIPRDTLVEPMLPARWRTAVGLPGNASKGVVTSWVWEDAMRSERLPETYRSEYRRLVALWPQDACDAYCLALAVSRLVETEAA